MIIRYTNTEKDSRNGKETFWFSVKLRGHEWTDILVGFDRNGKQISGSGTFLNLPKEQKEKIIEQTAPMVARYV